MYSCGLELQLELIHSFILSFFLWPHTHTHIYIHIWICIFSFDKVELFFFFFLFYAYEQYDEKNFLLFFTKDKRKLGEESAESNDNTQMCKCVMYIHVRCLSLLVSLAKGICTHSFIHIHHAIFSFSSSSFFSSSFFLSPIFFLVYIQCTIRRQMNSKLACLNGNVI